jgi:hypothetical protein
MRPVFRLGEESAFDVFLVALVGIEDNRAFVSVNDRLGWPEEPTRVLGVCHKLDDLEFKADASILIRIVRPHQRMVG